MKLEINSLKKPDNPYLRAAFRNRTDITASDRNSKKRNAEGNVSKKGTNINYQTKKKASLHKAREWLVFFET